jgi:flavin reductase (DIM6/NTAB) family NADH-FMN oxidoreductase RutF
VTDAEDGLAELLGGLDRTMWILTVAAGGERSGALMGFATQASIEPARFLACLSRANHTFGVVARADHVAVHACPDEPDLALARLFGEATGDEIDKFARCAWHDGPEGQPVLEGVPAWFVGRILDRFDLGDHVGLLLEPVVVDGEIDGVLTFERAQDLDAAH